MRYTIKKRGIYYIIWDTLYNSKQSGFKYNSEAHAQKIVDKLNKEEDEKNES